MVKVPRTEKSKKQSSGRPSRKAEIVQATETLLEQKGLSSVTTRAIAEAVPCSEGAIYVHFKNRLDLLLSVLQESLPTMLTPLHALEEKVGRKSPKENLKEAMGGLLGFHERVTPMLCSVFADAALRQRFGQSLREANTGPHRGIRSLANYIEQEQRHGRIAAEVDAEISSTILMATSFFHVFTSKLIENGAQLDIERLIDLVLSPNSTRTSSANVLR